MRKRFTQLQKKISSILIKFLFRNILQVLKYAFQFSQSLISSALISLHNTSSIERFQNSHTTKSKCSPACTVQFIIQSHLLVSLLRVSFSWNTRRGDNHGLLTLKKTLLEHIPTKIIDNTWSIHSLFPSLENSREASPPEWKDIDKIVTPLKLLLLSFNIIRHGSLSHSS